MLSAAVFYHILSLKWNSQTAVGEWYNCALFDVGVYLLSYL